MERRGSFTGDWEREYISRPPPQPTESSNEQATIEDPTIRQPNVTNIHTNEAENVPRNYPMDAETFIRRLDHASLEPDSERWSNLPELIDLSAIQFENMPEDIFASEEMDLPPYIDEMADTCPANCQIVLTVFKCGYYCFFTAQCLNHVWIGDRNGKPEMDGICNPDVVREPRAVPYACMQTFCPPCYEERKALLALILERRNQLRN